MQGADAGLYANDDIHAIRILLLEPTTRRRGRRAAARFYNHARERMRILGEIPVRKFGKRAGKQPLDPDGNPDTSFLAKIPADVAWTFQTLDKDGMVLNIGADLAPGPARRDPHTTAAAATPTARSRPPSRRPPPRKPDYTVFDLTRADAAADHARSSDESGKKWDAKDETGLRFEKRRQERRVPPRHQADPRAQLRRLPHAEVGQAGRQPRPRRRHASVKAQNPAGLGFDITVPGTYARLAADADGQVRAQAAAPPRLDATWPRRATSA